MNSISSYLLGILQKNIGTSDASSKVKGGKVTGQKPGLEPGQVVTGRLLKGQGGIFEIETDRGLLTAKGELDAPRGAMVKLRVLQGGTPARVRLESWSLENSGSGGRLRGLTALSRANISRLKALGSLLDGAENTPVSLKGKGQEAFKQDALPKLLTFFEMGGEKGAWQGAKDVEQAVKVPLEVGIRLLKAVLSDGEKAQKAISEGLQGDSKKLQNSPLKTDTQAKEEPPFLKGDVPLKSEGPKTETQAVSRLAHSVQDKNPLPKTHSLNTANAPLLDGEEKEGPLQVKSNETRGGTPGLKTEPLSKDSLLLQKKLGVSPEPRTVPNATEKKWLGGGNKAEMGKPYLGANREEIAGETGDGRNSSIKEGDGQGQGVLSPKDSPASSKVKSAFGVKDLTIGKGPFSDRPKSEFNNTHIHKGRDEAIDQASEASFKDMDAGNGRLDIDKAPLKSPPNFTKMRSERLFQEQQHLDQPVEHSRDGMHKTAMAPNRDAAIHHFAKAFLDQLDITQHLQMQLAQKGMELFIMPFFLSHFQGAGQWMFWKETEPENGDKGTEVSHLVFDLSLKNLGELDIHLLKRNESLFVYIRAEEDKVQVVRKGLFELSQALKGAGFKIADMEVAPRLEGADTISDIFLEDGPSGLHIVT